MKKRYVNQIEEGAANILTVIHGGTQLPFGCKNTSKLGSGSSSPGLSRASLAVWSCSWYISLRSC